MRAASVFACEGTLTRPEAPHQPVLLAETLELLRTSAGATVVDATLGPGGHAEALLERVGRDGRVIGIDRDPAAIAFARARLARFGDRFEALHGDHTEIASLLSGTKVDGILADLGISSYQLDDPSRGFAFSADGPLDMRMDPQAGGPTAASLVATLDAAELKNILATWGEERLAGADCARDRAREIQAADRDDPRARLARGARRRPRGPPVSHPSGHPNVSGASHRGQS